MLLGAPLAIGGVHVVSRATIAGIAALAWVWCAFGTRSGSSATSHLLWRALLGLAALTLFQLIPLPALWVGSFFEGRLETLHAVDSALGQPPRAWLPWALDVGRTSAAALDLLGWVCLMGTLGHLRRSVQPQPIVASLVMLAGLIVFGIGVLQLATGTEEILGLYRPDADLSRELFITTFVNPNHAGALLLMSALMAFGLWIDNKQSRHARLLLLACALLSLGVLATGSAANSILLLAGIPLIGLWAGRDLEPVQRTRVLRAIVGSFMLAGIAIMLFDPIAWWDTAVQPYMGDEETNPWSRLSELWEIGALISAEHLGFGVGYGSFPIAAAAKMTNWSGGFVNFAHNALLEGAASWGIYVMALFSGIVLIGLFRAARGAKTGLEVAIVVALCSTLIQNGVDFSLQIPGVGYAWAALLGTILVLPGRVPDRKAPGRRRHRLLAALLLAITVSVGAYAVPLDRRAALQTAQDELRRGEATAETRDRLVLEHSMDFIALGYGSDLSSALDEPERGLALAEVAVELAPHYPPGLLRRARIAIQSEPDERALEWIERLATKDYASFREAMSLAAQHSRERPELLMELAARSPRNVVGLSSALSGQGRTKAGAKMLEWGRKRFPQSEEIATHLIRQLLREPNNEKTRALMDSSAIQYLANSTSLEDPQESARLKRLGYLAMAHVHGREGRLEESWHLFEAAARLDLERDLDARLGQANILLRQGRYESLERLLRGLDPERVDEGQAQWRVHEFWSRLAEARGDLRQAIRSQQRALLFRPRDENLLLRLARLTEQRSNASFRPGGRSP